MCILNLALYNIHLHDYSTYMVSSTLGKLREDICSEKTGKTSGNWDPEAQFSGNFCRAEDFAQYWIIFMDMVFHQLSHMKIMCSAVSRKDTKFRLYYCGYWKLSLGAHSIQIKWYFSDKKIPPMSSYEDMYCVSPNVI